jgi:hypothetical protein
MSVYGHMGGGTCSVCSRTEAGGAKEGSRQERKRTRPYCVVVHPCPDAVPNTRAAAAVPIDIPAAPDVADADANVEPAVPDAVEVVHMVATLIDEMGTSSSWVDGLFPHMGVEWDRDTQFMCDA